MSQSVVLKSFAELETLFSSDDLAPDPDLERVDEFTAGASDAPGGKQPEQATRASAS